MTWPFPESTEIFAGVWAEALGVNEVVIRIAEAKRNRNLFKKTSKLHWTQVD
jgi:hypothetical protein